MTKKQKTTIAVLEKQLANYGVKTSYYFDRLSLYLDVHSRENDLVDLVQDNPNNKFLWQPLPHNDFLDRKIELFQPSAECLANLANPKIVRGDCAITYVEFAVDFIPDNQRILKKLVRFFNRHLVRIPSKRSKADPYYCNYDKTVYLSPIKDKECLLFYSDKPARNVEGSKLCLHLEYRVRGWKPVKKKNILTIDDLVGFDHQQLWNTQLDFRKPNLTELGVACRNRETSRQADHRRGIKEWGRIKSVQQYLSDHPERESVFMKITPAHLEQCLYDFMKEPD